MPLWLWLWGYDSGNDDDWHFPSIIQRNIRVYISNVSQFLRATKYIKYIQDI